MSEPVRPLLGVPRVVAPWVDTVGLIALAMVIGQGIWRGVLVARGFFVQDDFLMFYRAGGELSLDMLTQNYSGHLFPGGFLISWAQVHWAPLDWGIAATSIIVLQALAAILAWVVLCRLLPGRWARLPIFAVYLFSPITLITTQWWAVAIQFFPVTVFLFLAIYGLLLRVQDDSRWGTPIMVAATVVGLLFQERAILYPIVLGFLAVALVGRPDTGRLHRRVLSALRLVWPAWAALLFVLLGYLVWHRQAAPIAATTAGSASDNIELVVNLFFRNLLPGLAGGPWDPSVLGNALVHPPDWAVGLGCSLVVLLALWTIRRGRGPAAWAWALLICYAVIDAVLLFGGRAGLGPSFGLLPRYTSDIVPVAMLTLALAVRDVRPREAARSAGRLSPALGAVLAVVAYVASALPTTLVVGPASYNEFARNYVTNLRSDLQASPGVVVFDGLVPREVMTNWFGDDGRVSVVTATAPERPVFDQPSYNLRMVDVDGRLRPIDLVAMVPMRKPAGEGECGFPVRSERPATIPLRKRVSDDDLILRIGYFTSLKGSVIVRVAGEEQSFDLDGELNLVDLVVSGSFDEVVVEVESDGKGTLCVPQLDVGYAVPRR